MIACSDETACIILFSCMVRRLQTFRLLPSEVQNIPNISEHLHKTDQTLFFKSHNSQQHVLCCFLVEQVHNGYYLRPEMHRKNSHQNRRFVAPSAGIRGYSPRKNLERICKNLQYIAFFWPRNDSQCLP